MTIANALPLWRAAFPFMASENEGHLFLPYAVEEVEDGRQNEGHHAAMIRVHFHVFQFEAVFLHPFLHGAAAGE